MAIPVVSEVLNLLLSNPLLAWLTLVTAFAIDSWIAYGVKFEGVVGWVATQSGRYLTSNSTLEITSFQILVLVVVIPVFVLALQHSAQGGR